MKWLRNHLREPLYLQSYFLLMATAMTAGTGFCFWLAAAHLTDPGSVGRAGALVSAIGLIGYLTSFGLPYGILRFGSGDCGVVMIAVVAIILTAVTSAIAGSIFALGSTYWASDLRPILLTATGLGFFAAACAASSVSVLVDNLFAARRAAQHAFYRSSLAGFAKLLLLALLPPYTALGLYFATFAPIIVCAPIFGASALRIASRSQRSRTASRSAVLRPFVTYSVATFPAGLLGGAPPFLLPLVVLSVRGARDTAFFYVAWNLISVLLMLPAVVSQIALSESQRGEPWDVAARARKFALTLTTPLVLAVILGGAELLKLYGSAYANSGPRTLQLLALSLIPWVFMVVNWGALRALARHRELAVSNAVFAGTTLLLSVSLGHEFGLHGVAAGWLAGMVLSAGHLEFIVRPLRRGQGSANAFLPETLA